MNTRPLNFALAPYTETKKEQIIFSYNYKICKLFLDSMNGQVIEVYADIEKFLGY